MTDPNTPPFAPLTDEELDRLADYLADALSPADAAQVEQRIGTDPRWAAEYTDLVRAHELVRSQLAAVAELPEPIPVDVLARLDAALATADGNDVVTAGRATTPAPRHSPLQSGVAGTSRLPAQRDSGAASARGARDATRPGTRPRRAGRILLGIAAGVVAMSFAAAIGWQLPKTTNSTTSRPALDSAAEGGAPTGALTPELDAGHPVVLATDTDYTPQLLVALGHTALSAGTPVRDTEKGAAPPAAVVANPGPFAKLATTGDLAACLKLVSAEHPGSAVLVDYARFEGTPALVILIHQANSSVAVVVGPGCGAGDADERAVVAVP